MLEQIKEMLHRDPFTPFRISLTSGLSFDVLYPGLVAEGSSQLIYCFPKSDRYAILRLNQVASIETLDRSGHGKQRGRRN